MNDESVVLHINEWQSLSFTDNDTASDCFSASAHVSFAFVVPFSGSITFLSDDDSGLFVLEEEGKKIFVSIFAGG
jgi:hypothetical protein